MKIEKDSSGKLYASNDFDKEELTCTEKEKNHNRSCDVDRVLDEPSVRNEQRW